MVRAIIHSFKKVFKKIRLHPNGITFEFMNPETIVNQSKYSEIIITDSKQPWQMLTTLRQKC